MERFSEFQSSHTSNLRNMIWGEKKLQQIQFELRVLGKFDVLL
jgi:hypothetical protein